MPPTELETEPVEHWVNLNACPDCDSEFWLTRTHHPSALVLGWHQYEYHDRSCPRLRRAPNQQQQSQPTDPEET